VPERDRNIMMNPAPACILDNPNLRFSLVNSVDFSSDGRYLVVTFTSNNVVGLYSIDQKLNPVLVTRLRNPLLGQVVKSAKLLNEPSFAAFSPDSKILAVSNYGSATINIYKRSSDKSGYGVKPCSIFHTPNELKAIQPHTMAFSRDGKHLAVTYFDYSRTCSDVLVIYSVDTDRAAITDEQALTVHLPGSPKGVAYTPDGTHLAITLCDTNSVSLYDLEKGCMTQILKNPAAGLSLPENIAFTPDGSLSAVVNSADHSIAFYRFDKAGNVFTDARPCFVLKNPEAGLRFPHGIAFSPDGKVLAITQFGPVKIAKNGDIECNRWTMPREDKVLFYGL